MERSTVSFGILAARAFCMRTRSLGLAEGSGPDALTQMMISFEILVKVLDMFPQRLNMRAFLYSKALPIILFIISG
jgi:hypothetical protein